MLVYIEYWLFFHILLLTWVFSFRFYDELLSISENFKFYVRRLSTDALFSSVFRSEVYLIWPPSGEVSSVFQKWLYQQVSSFWLWT